ncbi:MAG TPA: tetratricopeptide repeat protein [Candidatus Limnocylindrales bacterium]|nr:tetratricopeptide repeat protein [Candidatus Limnocylindrales bacterium]
MLVAIIGLSLVFLQAQTQANSAAPAQTAETSLTTQEIPDLQAKAQAGDIAAQMKMGRACRNGEGVPKDAATAFEWYRKAAMQGNADAQEIVGEMYRSGDGVEENRQAAARFWHQSARLGNANAMWNLGAAYYNGDGVDVDDALSYAWFLLAKEAGNERAIEAVQRGNSDLKPTEIRNAFIDLAEMYDRGIFLPKDEEKAERWWSEAGRRGDKESAEMAKAVAHRYGYGTRKDARSARKEYESLAALRYSPAMRAAAEMEAIGEGGKVDHPAAAILYVRLIQVNDGTAFLSLAKLKTQMDAKEWRKVEKQLPIMHIDAAKLDAALDKAETR